MLNDYTSAQHASRTLVKWASDEDTVSLQILLFNGEAVSKLVDCFEVSDLQIVDGDILSKAFAKLDGMHGFKLSDSGCLENGSVGNPNKQDKNTEANRKHLYVYMVQ